MAEYCALTPMSFHPMSGADACGIDTANMTQDHSNRDGAGLTDPLGTCIMQSGLELCPRPTRGLYAHTKPTGAFPRRYLEYDERQYQCLAIKVVMPRVPSAEGILG
jgi:hypothetical protein